jgi:AcrR family transcriptional regulator
VADAVAPSGPRRRGTDRRAELIAAAQRVILKKSLEATTLRDIAREGGFTTGVASHWFPDKQALIVACFEATSDDWITSTRARIGVHADALGKLAAMVREGVPHEPARQEQYRLWSEMWAYAQRDPAFAQVLIETDRHWERLIGEVLRACVEDGLLRADLDVAAQATIVARLVDGLGIRACLSGEWDAARAALVSYLETIGLDPAHARGLGRGSDPEEER